MMQFKASDDLRAYTGLGMSRVYEIAAQGYGPVPTGWQLQVRDRARLVGVPIDEQFRVIGTYKNLAWAMACARAEEEA